VLQLGNRALGGAGNWRSFLEEHNYVWVATGAGLTELDEAVEPFDFVVAESLFSTIPFNGVARSIAAVLRYLRPSGRFYATWFENPDPASFDAIVRSNGITTHPDSEPYHYPFGLVATVCDALGASVERLPGAVHPSGQSVLVMARSSRSLEPPRVRSV
jgi:hypothetical protein